MKLRQEMQMKQDAKTHAPQDLARRKAGSKQHRRSKAPSKEIQGRGPRAADQSQEGQFAQSSEIVIGIIGPLGTDNDKIRDVITARLENYGYKTKVVSIAKMLIPALAGPNRMPEEPFRRAMTRMDLGNEIRRKSRNMATLALAAAAEIRRQRPDPQGPVQKVAYIVSSLKNPDEVAELRKIYSGGFYLFAVHTDNEKRIKNLESRGMKSSQAVQLISRDEDELQVYGQHTRDAFHLADFFVADESNDDKLRFSIYRCLDLIFGNATITPTFNEFAMFMAFAAALRSADLSRQVGAVVARGNEILSTGANDCPCPGGGLYWPIFIGDRVDDAPLGRDFKRGFDSNSFEKTKLINEIVKGFPVGQRKRVEKILRNSRLRDLTEYGRAVHAEMEALLACSRINVSCVGATLYCSTFPCHNCAKHIIAAGIEQVIYIEPYPKSKALEFHDDALTTKKLNGGEKRVRFKPFIGVGPRQFFDLFSLSLSAGRPIERKRADGSVATWAAKGATPRMRMSPLSYRDFELDAFDFIKKLKHN